jgi:hypothetical protein
MRYFEEVRAVLTQPLSKQILLTRSSIEAERALFSMSPRPMLISSRDPVIPLKGLRISWQRNAIRLHSASALDSAKMRSFFSRSAFSTLNKSW